MVLFDKEVNVKTYGCSRNNQDYVEVNPKINLYIQTTPACNAQCYFCYTRCHSIGFDFTKLEEIIKELESKVKLGKIAITGGEPLLVPNRVHQIIDICKNHYVTLNTNAFDIKKVKEIYPYVKEIHISKHHYDNKKNDEIMKITTPSLLEIYDYGLTDKVKINCVWQKGYMEKKEDLIKMLELMSYFGFKEIRNISLLPLTQEGIENYINLSDLMKECEAFLNDGYLYDKEMCKCFEFIYLANNGRVIKSLIRQTFNDEYSCVKQLVYDGEHLYDGFKKNNIIY